MTISPIRIWLAFLSLCLIWGSSYLFIRIGLRHLAPTALVALRLLTGAVVVVAFVRLRGQSLRMPRRRWLLLVGVATINTSLPFWLISWAELSVPSGLASVLNSTVPIFSVLLAAVVLQDEPLTLPRLAGVVIGFGGIIVLVSRDLSQSGLHSSSFGGQLAIIAASICYAVGAVLVRKLLRGIPSPTLAAHVLMVTAAQTVILSIIFSRPAFGSLLPETIFAVLWLGVLGSGIAYMLAYFVLENWGASRYTLVAYSLPVVGLALGVIVLGESLSWTILLGSALVVGGIILASLVRRRAPVTESPTLARAKS